jgi:hypothetical protein
MDGRATAQAGSRRLLIVKTQVLSPARRGGIYDGKYDNETNFFSQAF